MVSVTLEPSTVGPGDILAKDSFNYKETVWEIVFGIALDDCKTLACKLHWSPAWADIHHFNRVSLVREIRIYLPWRIVSSCFHDLTKTVCKCPVNRYFQRDLLYQIVIGKDASRWHKRTRFLLMWIYNYATRLFAVVDSCKLFRTGRVPAKLRINIRRLINPIYS